MRNFSDDFTRKFPGKLLFKKPNRFIIQFELFNVHLSPDIRIFDLISFVFRYWKRIRLAISTEIQFSKWNNMCLLCLNTLFASVECYSITQVCFVSFRLVEYNIIIWILDTGQAKKASINMQTNSQIKNQQQRKKRLSLYFLWNHNSQWPKADCQPANCWEKDVFHTVSISRLLFEVVHIIHSL